MEDETEYQQKLEDYIARFSDEHGVSFSVSLFADGMDLTEEYRGGLDIILMDIKLKHMDGMEAARAIRRVDETVVIIFITSMAQYAVAGYEVDALDFVVKPVEYPRFEMKLQKAVKAVEKTRRRKYLLLSFEGGRRRVSTDEILYVEVRNHNLYYVTSDATYVQRSSMADVQRELEEYHFVRCNQSYLVNLKNVVGVERDDVQVGSYRLPFSRSRKKDFLAQLASYLEAGYS